MNCNAYIVPAMTVLMAAAAAPVFAHHSVSAEFDVARPMVYQGAVTGIDWSNPHVYLYIAVPNQGGTPTGWAFQAAGPNTLVRRGWLRNTIKLGDHITVVAYPARDGVAVASLREVRLADGRRILATPQAQQ